MNHRLADVSGSYSAQLSQNCDLCYVHAYEWLKPPESQYGIYVSTVFIWKSIWLSSILVQVCPVV